MIKRWMPRTLIATLLVASGITVGIGTAASTSSSAPLAGGDSITVTCSGAKLTANKISNVKNTLSCSKKSTPPTTTTTTTTVPPTTTTTTLPGNSGAPTICVDGSNWCPTDANPIAWQWYLGGEINTPPTAAQLGAGDTTYDGKSAASPTVYDIDGIDNTKANVAALHQMGAKVICYIEVGTAGNYYGNDDGNTSYYAELQSDGDFGNKLSGYPENFININNASTVTIVKSMIHDQCAAKGFDAVETDLDETYTGYGNLGFPETQADEITYLTNLANYMHSLGLAWVAKNLDDTDSDSFVSAVEPFADTIITEQCEQYNSCGLLSPFSQHHKAIFNAEYKGPASGFCPAANLSNMNSVLFNVNLNGKVRTPCR